ncbi:hypothetical protein CHX26_08640 [Porphyrobacter sp. HT-58-2]|uniref:hypothetical protein n=1 Tax=Porphyrobacter sp. HT-58-2 TaxID=2023229 RepID=UPI000CDBEFF6|nr:hypothetical protein [Porphyrobacter sp. HT-58-2]AUX69548.1 hypothetical protein CHX26_08640 [Porphyrobacter sp. HT-58-2]
MSREAALAVMALMVAIIVAVGWLLHRKGDKAGTFLFLYMLFVLIVAILITLLYALAMFIRMLS